MNSDYIRSLPPQVKKRINALKNLQKKHMETEVEFHKEFHMLELKYQEKMAELTQQVKYLLYTGGSLMFGIIFMARIKYDCNLDQKRDQMWLQ